MHQSKVTHYDAVPCYVKALLKYHRGCACGMSPYLDSIAARHQSTLVFSLHSVLHCAMLSPQIFYFAYATSDSESPVLPRQRV